MTKLKELYWICGCVVEILLIVFLSLIFYLNEMEKAFTFNFDIYTVKFINIIVNPIIDIDSFVIIFT